MIWRRLWCLYVIIVEDGDFFFFYWLVNIKDLRKIFKNFIWNLDVIFINEKVFYFLSKNNYNFIEKCRFLIGYIIY